MDRSNPINRNKSKYKYYKIFNSISIFAIMLICLFTYLSIEKNLSNINEFIDTGINFFNNTNYLMRTYEYRITNSLNLIDTTFININNRTFLIYNKINNLPLEKIAFNVNNSINLIREDFNIMFININNTLNEINKFNLLKITSIN